MNEIKVEAGGAHYGKIDPFVLTRVMKTSGNAHVDFCRGNIIKYAFRVKGDKFKILDDLKKAGDYVNEAVKALERDIAGENQPELFKERGENAPKHYACDTCPSMGSCPQVCVDAHMPPPETPRAVPPCQKCGEPIVDGLPSCTCGGVKPPWPNGLE